jgi:hypothetical protein
MSNVGKKILRTTKNNLGGYTDIQVKIRKATSNENKCANNLLLNDIALASWNEQQFIEIMEILEKRLNDKGKNWRHVYKSLTVLEYLLYHGSEMVVKYIQNNIYIIKTLRDFQYIDENNQDEGINVRVKSKEIYDIVSDEAKLLKERSRLKTGKTKTLSSSKTKNLNDYNEDLEIRKAIENSKETLIQDEKRRESKRSHENLLSTEKNSREKGKSSKNAGKEKNKEKDLLILDEPIPDEIQPNNQNMLYQQMQYQQMQQQFQGMDFFGNNNNSNMIMGNTNNNNNMLMENTNNNNMLIGNTNYNNMLMGNTNNNNMLTGNTNNNNMLMGNTNNNNMLLLFVFPVNMLLLLVFPINMLL